MKRIYEVAYHYKCKGCGPLIDGRERVLANGDAQVAVDRVRKGVLRDKDVTAFKLRSVSVLAETSY